jgi:hypothetical protein
MPIGQIAITMGALGALCGLCGYISPQNKVDNIIKIIVCGACIGGGAVEVGDAVRNHRNLPNRNNNPIGLNAPNNNPGYRYGQPGNPGFRQPGQPAPGQPNPGPRFGQAQGPARPGFVIANTRRGQVRILRPDDTLN